MVPNRVTHHLLTLYHKIYWLSETHPSFEHDKNSCTDINAKHLTQSWWPVKVFSHFPAFHDFMVLSADPVLPEEKIFNTQYHSPVQSQQ